VILVGILFAKHFWWIDSVLGIIVSLMLFYATYEIAWEAINRLLGKRPDAKLISEITESVNSIFDEDMQLHHFHMHDYVNHKELTFHIKLPNSFTVEKGHQIATEIEKLILSRYEIHATVHVEPLQFEHSTD
jgi:divalent metal cation (Fe/Co/Zn/Cd) transporter